MEKGRVEAFSDGVFAIAITLLVLNLHVPEKGLPLGATLRQEWPSFAAYVVSFMIIGIMWVNHHAMFHNVAVVGRPMLFLNLLLLMFVAVLPFPTALLAGRLSGEGSHIAAAVYSINMFMNAVAFQLLWRWIAHDPRHLHERIDPAVARGSQARFAVGLFVYAGTIGLSFVNAKLTLAVHFAIALYYVFDQLPTRAAAAG